MQHKIRRKALVLAQKEEEAGSHAVLDEEAAETSLNLNFLLTKMLSWCTGMRRRERKRVSDYLLLAETMIATAAMKYPIITQYVQIR